MANLRSRAGINKDKLNVVEDLHPTEQGALTDLQWTVLRYADAMTTNVVVDEGWFGKLRGSGLDERQIVELTATIAGYNCVSRLLVALVHTRHGWH